MTRRPALEWSPGAAGPLLPEPGLSWQDSAACASVDPELFYPEKGGSVARAKRICASCPVTAECLEYGIDDIHGVYGGKSAPERELLRRQRDRAGGQPAVRRCLKGLHALTPENTIGTGTCRECRRIAAHRRYLGEAA